VQSEQHHEAGTLRGISFVVQVTDGVDAGRDVCRLHPDAIAALGVRAWDPVLLHGERQAAALVGHLNWEAPRNRCQIDPTTAQNVGLASGDTIAVAAVAPVVATRVWVGPPHVDAAAADDTTGPTVPLDAIRTVLLGKAVLAGEREALVAQDYTRPLSAADMEQVRTLTQHLSRTGESPHVRVVRTDPGGVVMIGTTTQLFWEDTAATVVTAGPDPDVTVADLGGVDLQIAELRELFDLTFTNRALLERLGAAAPQAILIDGPTGSGKGELVYAVSAEFGASVRRVSGLDLEHTDAASATAALSKLVESATPGTPHVVLLEELDRICPSDPESGSTKLLPPVLAVLDGLAARPDVIVVGTTIAPDRCHPELFKPGRFNRQIEIPLPDRTARVAMLDVHTRRFPLADDVAFDDIAARTPGFVGGDIAKLCRQAAIAAAKRLRDTPGAADASSPDVAVTITAADFTAALEIVRPSALGNATVETGGVTWEDVGDAVETKRHLTEAVVWPIRYPDTFSRLGMAPPRGVLLYGPPGSGKTFIVRALAGESEANLVSVKGAELLSKWVGESEAGVRDVFRRARSAAPSIVFLDEIDALAPPRGGGTDSGVTDRVVAQLLTELDGVEPLRGVTVIAATNRPDLIDPALLRPGRLDRHVFVEPPDAEARVLILRAICRKMPLASDVDLDGIALHADGFSAADLDALSREAGFVALRRDPSTAHITHADFGQAFATVTPSVKPEVVEALRAFKSAPA
jgi:transitional endoplasmic reticulum ATPase